MRYMPARNPQVAERTQAWLSELGGQLRDRRRALGLSAATTAESAGMSRVTLHRIEAGSAAVTIGAYLNAAVALGLRLTLEDGLTNRVHAGPQTPDEQPPPETVRVGDFPQLRAIAWQLRADTTLPGVEALQLYERNWRHVDQSAMADAERALVRQLANAYSRGTLLV